MPGAVTGGSPPDDAGPLYSLFADRTVARFPGGAVLRAAGADDRAGIPGRRNMEHGEFRTHGGRSQFHRRDRQYVRDRPRCRPAAAGAGARNGDDAAAPARRARHRAVGLVDPARHLRSRGGPRVARDPHRQGLSEHHPRQTRRAERTAELAQLRNPSNAFRRDRRRGAVAGYRDRAGHPRRRRAARPKGIWRGGRCVRRHTLAAFHSGDLAAAPSIQTALILRTVLAFEMFAIVLSIGGRNFPVLVSEAFNWQYNQQDYGVAAAYAVIVMGVSLAATLVYLRVLRTPAAQQ